MSAFKFPVSEQADCSESEHAGFVTPMRLVGLPDIGETCNCIRKKTVQRYVGSPEL